MRKYFFTTCILISFYLPSWTQNAANKITERKVDSLKRILPGMKGNARIDCLNSIALGLFFLWEDPPYLLDAACTVANLAYNEAKKSNYKAGLGYALLNMQICAGGRADENRDNNNTDAGYKQTEKYAEQAIDIGKEINDNNLIGGVYEHLAWLERWKGTFEKYQDRVLKAIEYYEKPSTLKRKNGFVPINFINWPYCESQDLILGNLYIQQSSFQAGLPALRKSIIEKAIYHFQKSMATSNLAGAYTALANAVMPSGNIETSLELFNKSLALYQENGNEIGETDAYINICSALFNLGDFETGIAYSKKSVALAEKIARANGRLNEKDLKLYQAYYWMGRFYSIANDMETAFSFLRKAQFYCPNNRWMEHCLTAIAEFHRSIGNYDSAMHYLSFTINNKETSIGKRILSATYISMKQYDKGMEIINSRMGDIINDYVNLGKTYTNAAKAYYGKNDYPAALTNARQGLTLLKITSRNFSLVENYQLLSDIFNKMGQYDSAYYYLKQYTESKDLLLKKQLYIKLNDYKKEAEEAKRTGQVNLLQKDYFIKEQELKQQVLLREQNQAQLALLDKSNELKDQKLKEQTLLKEQNQSQLILLDKENKLKDQRLKQQAFIRNALLGGLLLFLLLGVFVFRSLSLKRKNEKLAIKKNQAEFQQKVAELEMQALRAQMNPHFIFNCLNSINRFIFKNETKEASDYLTRFSRLIRMVLLHSQKKLVPLEDELEMLKLYLDMERLRFKNAFDYHITTTNAIENASVFIPPLLLQPFCENAIWHGLMHKDGQGHLNIELSETGGILYCSITDDGVGREKADEYKSKSAEKEKSMGLKITRERLSLLNQGTTGGTYYEIEDVKNDEGKIAGTRVQLKIKYKETVEEMIS